MKKFFLALILVCITNLNALSSISAIPVEEKTLLDKVLNNLNFTDASEESRAVIHKQLKPFLKDGWYTHWLSNGSGDDSKIAQSDTRFADIMIYNNDRVVNITLIYFKQNGQIFISTKETIEVGSEDALTKFREKQKDAQLENLNETDNYAVFNKKGYMAYETVHIKEPNALMVYETSNYLNVTTKSAVIDKISIGGEKLPVK